MMHRFRFRAIGTWALLLLLPALAFAQANGELQIHQLNVGQGDAALIVSPLGETMLIDTGPTSSSSCQSGTGIITQLTSLGLTRLDYHVASHYHADHIGCSDLVVNRWPVQVAAYDRGTASLPSTQVYTRYANTVSLKRQTVSLGQQIVLDAASANPVIFRVVATNGNGVSGSLDENDRSVVLVLTFGSFDAIFGGDLETRGEAVLAATVGQVELYKVHHHGSSTSSTATFVNAIHPKVAALSMGAPNPFDHPTATALGNIHAIGSTAYWSTSGDGAAPGSMDVVANGTIRTQVPAGGASFTVTAAGASTTYTSWGVPPPTCTYIIDPTFASFGSGGVIAGATVNTASGCPWTAESNAGFVSILNGSSGTGPGTVTYSLSSTAFPRSGTMTIAGLTFSVSQAAPPFTDDPLQPGVSFIRAVHITELRVRMDALRERYELAPFGWTDASSVGTFVKAVHLSDLRTALAQVYDAADVELPIYTDPTLVPGVTVMKVAHVAELRAAMVAVE